MMMRKEFCIVRISPPFSWAHFNGESSSSSSGSDEHDFFSPCHSYFDTRYAIGTHTAKRDIMELFTSKHGNYRYVSTAVQCV